MALHDWLAQKNPALAAATIFISGGAFTPRAREFLDKVPNPRLEKPLDSERLLALLNDKVR